MITKEQVYERLELLVFWRQYRLKILKRLQANPEYYWRGIQESREMLARLEGEELVWIEVLKMLVEGESKPKGEA